MFTGIVETVSAIYTAGNRLVLRRPDFYDDLRLGSSICVCGVCLSIVGFDDGSMSFDVVVETLAKTTLGGLRAGDSVNLERSLRADGRFEGHIVQGHIEGTAEVELPWNSDSGFLSLVLPVDIAESVVAKGSIAIDGVSLTVASKEGNRIAIALIPHTLENTTLGGLRSGDKVNIETDILGRYVRAMVRS